MKQLTEADFNLVNEALEMNRVMGRDEHGNYTKDCTPKKIIEALAILASLKDQEPLVSTAVSNDLRVTEDMVQGLKEANTLLDDITTKILDREERLHYLQNQNGITAKGD